MSLFPLLNRSVLVVRPRAPFAQWISSMEAQLPEEERTPISLDELQFDSSAYLIPETDPEEQETILDEAWPMIFESELASWFDDEEAWPTPRTREMFDEWFETSLNSLVMDLVDAPLETD